MLSTVDKLQDSLERRGVRGTIYRVLDRVYGDVRPYLPRGRRVSFNSVTVNVHRRPLDPLFPAAARRARAYDQPEYDSGLVDGVRENVTEGGMVVVVGGGFGVTTVAAARRVGRDGFVLTFEVATERVADVRAAVSHHGLSDRVTVLHAAVERVVNPLGDVGDAPTVPPRALPPCDVLVLDCDGPEASILRGLEVRPRALVVNTTTRFGAPESEVRAAIEALGYRVVSRSVANEGSREFCLENGYYALTAVDGTAESTRPSESDAIDDPEPMTGQ